MPTESATAPTATERAWRELLDFLLKETSDRKLALRCASEIHGPVCMFGYSQRLLPPTKDALASGKATRPLERLERTAKYGGVRWTNAWNALTRAAYNCLVSGNPGKPVPLTNGAPNPADILPLIPGALTFARTRSKALTERRIALITILRSYRIIYKAKPTVASAKPFIEKLEKIYGDHLPTAGFNIGSAGSTVHTGTLHALIGESLKHP